MRESIVAGNGSREATATSTQDVSTLTEADRRGDCCFYLFLPGVRLSTTHTINFVQFRAGRLHELHDPPLRRLFVARARAGYIHAFVACPPVSSITRLNINPVLSASSRSPSKGPLREPED